jgi:hypothetical protein
MLRAQRLPGQLPPPNDVSDGGSFRRKRPWYPRRHEHTTTMPGKAANDPRQHARQRRAVVRGVVLAMSPDTWADDVPVLAFGYCARQAPVALAAFASLSLLEPDILCRA